MVMYAFASLLFMMLAAHALCDLPLQPASLSEAKRPGGNPALPWPVALGAHGLIHGGAVAWVTGLWILGLCETIAHALIDGAKCRGLIGMKVDQLLHLWCKLAWAYAAVRVYHG
jgi:hypothetical protein